MRIKFSFEIKIEPTPKDDDYRESDIPGTQTERDMSEYSDGNKQKVGFSA